MFANVHGESAGATTETVTLGSELAAITLFAVESGIVAVDVGGIEALVAEVALEADLVPLQATGEELLSGVDGLVASQANVGHFGL